MGLNNTTPPRNRGIELLLYKRSKPNTKKLERKFLFNNKFSFFNREFHFNFELSIIKKNVSLGE